MVPTLVRAAILIIIHPSLAAEEGGKAALRMDILLKVAQFSSLLTFPITAITLAILQQYNKNDATITALILLFWEANQWNNLGLVCVSKSASQYHISSIYENVPILSSG